MLRFMGFVRQSTIAHTIKNLENNYVIFGKTKLIISKNWIFTHI